MWKFDHHDGHAYTTAFFYLEITFARRIREPNPKPSFEYAFLHCREILQRIKRRIARLKQTKQRESWNNKRTRMFEKGDNSMKKP